jgi:aerobic-type carbon monoxide dehydrogenase small subunit (CoxS/CutS family)
VLHNGKEIRACITPVAAVGTGTVTTLEGLPALWRGKSRTTSKESNLHPVQQAWIDEQVPQCGYCQNGMMIRATELLNRVKRPTEAQIKSHMNTHLCRCGTYHRITKAINRASATMAKGA